MVSRANWPSPPGRLINLTNTALSPAMNVGHPEHIRVERTTRSCSSRTTLAGHPDSTSDMTGVGIGTRPGQGPTHHGRIPEIPTFIVTCREQGAVHGQEMLFEPIPDRHAGGQGEQIGLLGRIVPRRCATLGYVRLVEEEGNERHRPRGPCLQPVQDVLVAVPGERASVVPGDGKIHA